MSELDMSGFFKALKESKTLKPCRNCHKGEGIKFCRRCGLKITPSEPRLESIPVEPKRNDLQWMWILSICGALSILCGLLIHSASSMLLIPTLVWTVVSFMKYSRRD
jgi:hypothetical protein